ncbi:MAG: response regulator, partial [Deltaproteobacteria bacterium]|nr:response regulator [Deltaproteobacteria bacterium]
MCLTLLIVDDEPLICRSLKRELKSSPCQVLLAGNGEEALKVLDTVQVDVMVTDHRMPGLSGAELIRRARQMQPHLMAIVLSATPEEARVALGEPETPV